MRRFWMVPLLTVLIGPVATSPAQVAINVPYAQLRIGQPTVVQTPFVRLVAPGRAPVVVPQGAPLLPPPAPLLDPGAPPPVPLDVVPARPVPPVGSLPLRVPTLAEFVTSYRAAPTGGHFEVVLLHPYTCQPVKVCFDLPGCPKRVRAGKNQVDFRYGLCKVVSLRFYPDGTVRVRN